MLLPTFVKGAENILHHFIRAITLARNSQLKLTSRSDHHMLARSAFITIQHPSSSTPEPTQGSRQTGIAYPNHQGPFRWDLSSRATSPIHSGTSRSSIISPEQPQ
ncbi:hypothetical protein Nepgr_013503 [Nepenthes gracilis]|uniref:Uncharacterized protein n=1 Tax=Nepenthes gracilis TaxID=150966 RepID=A0AAD3SIF0_NEPGR|nr:hypothetical protein Nepgr_013503 [Nepenthes gracilis]